MPLRSVTRNAPVLVLVLVLLASCSQVSDPSVPVASSAVEVPVDTDDTFSNESIYGQWSVDEVVDSIYSDTLFHRDYLNPSQADTFYLRRIIELAALVQASAHDNSGLFPESAFDSVVARHAHPFEGRRGDGTTYGPAIALSEDHVHRLLSLLNNPINFTWGECGTWEPNARFEFLLAGRVVRFIDDGCIGQFRTDYPRIKFGSLSSPRRTEYRALLAEIGILNE